MEVPADEVRRSKGEVLSPTDTGLQTIMVMPGQAKGNMSNLQIGDNLPVDLLSFRAAECLVSNGPPEAEDVCVLDAGHTGNHLAAGADMVVRAVWS